jgi:signal peptidase II
MSTCLAISILVVVFDQLSKTIVSTNMEVGDSIVIIEKVLSFTYVRNEGAAWGILSDHRWIFLVLTALAIIAIPIITYKLRGFGYFFAIAMSLIWGGAIGNMIDRLFIGSVVDFIEVTFIEYPVFNIADSCVVIGGIMLLIYLVFINKTLFR